MLKSLDRMTKFNVIEEIEGRANWGGRSTSSSDQHKKVFKKGRSVAFLSRTLQGLEKHYVAVEKEGCAITEAIRHWRHYLTGKHIIIRTEKYSVSYMFN